MRWKIFIPVVVIAALITVFNIFLFDSVLKGAFIGTGEIIFGAKVEISKVKTEFKKLSIDIRGIKIANRNDVFKNLAEIDRIAFSAKPIPLLSKKVIIEKMTIEGIRYGTKRDTSGALPPRKEKNYQLKQQREAVGSAVGKLFENIKKKAEPHIQELPGTAKINQAQKELENMKFEDAVSVNDLESVKEMEKIEKELNEKFAKYEAELKSMNLEEKSKMVDSAIKILSGMKIEKIEDVEPAMRGMDSLSKTHKEVSETIAQLQSLQSRVSKDFGSEADLINRINKLKEKDFNALADKFKLPTFSFGKVSESIFGPVWIGRVNSVTKYMALTRKYMPPPKKKEDKAIVKTKFKGRDIVFRKKNNPPDLLISKVLITGSTGGYGKEGVPLEFKGIVTDITSDPALLGRPTKMTIAGEQGKRKLIVRGIFDHTRDEAIDKLDLLYTGIPAESIGLPKSDYVPEISKGDGIVSGKMFLKDEKINSVLSLKLRNIKIKKGSMDKMMVSVWSGIPEISVSAKLTGNFDNPSVSVTSNLDKVLSQRLKAVFGQKVAAMQNRLKAEINKLTNAKKNAVLAQLTSKKGEILGQYKGSQDKLQSDVNSAKSEVSNKEKEINDQADAEKKKAEEEIQKQADEVLKNLF